MQSEKTWGRVFLFVAIKLIALCAARASAAATAAKAGIPTDADIKAATPEACAGLLQQTTEVYLRTLAEDDDAGHAAIEKQITPALRALAARTRPPSTAGVVALLKEGNTFNRKKKLGLSGIERLKTKPDDAAASDNAGHWLCFYARDWDQGLPYLTHDSDPEIKKLALLEKASQAPDKLLDVAKQWAVLPPKISLDALAAANVRDHARALCAQISQTATGFAHDEAEQSLTNIQLLGGAAISLAPPPPKEKVHKSPITDLVFTPDSRILISVSRKDQAVATWDAASGAVVARVALAHDNEIKRVMAAPNNKWVLVCMPYPGSMLFNLANLQTELYSVKDAIGFALSSDGRSLLGTLSHHDEKIETNAMDRGKDAPKLISTRTVRERSVSALIFTPDEKLILAGYVQDGEVRAFVSAKVSDTPLWTAKCTGGPVGSLRIAPDGKSVWACGWENCKICQIDLASGEVLTSLAAQNSRARKLPDVSPNTAYLLGWNNKNSIAELWDLGTKKVVAHFGGTSITTVCWHPDSRRVLWSDGVTLHLWDAVTHADVTTFDTGKSSIAVIAVSPDGKWAATGTADGEVRLWPMPVIRAGK